jgi:hypothetical protein
VAASGLLRLLAHLLSPSAHAFWRTHTFSLQLLQDVAVVQGGSLVALQRMSRAMLAAHALTAELSVSPLCVVAGRDAQLAVRGAHVGAPGAQVVLKSGGAYLAAAGSSSSKARCGEGCGAAVAAAGGADGDSTDSTAAAAGGDSASAADCVSCTLQAPDGASSSNVVWVEVSHGSYLSAPRPLLVVGEAGLAAEVNSLAALQDAGALSAGQVDALLLDLGLVLSHITSARHDASAGHGSSKGGGAHSDAAASTAAHSASGASKRPAPGSGGAPGSSGARRPAVPHALVAHKARRLLAFACDQGWLAVAGAVLPLAQACGSCAADIVAAIHAATPHDGLSLLHRAVRSGCPELVRGVLAWGAAHGYAWPIGAGGPRGISPLHLAALVDDGGTTALLLLDACELPSAFTESVTCDGVSPFHLAFQMGHWGLDRVLATLKRHWRGASSAAAGDGAGAGGAGGRGSGSAASAVMTSVVEQQLAPSGWQLLREATASMLQQQQAVEDEAGVGGGASAAAAGAASAAAPACTAQSQRKPLKERHTSVLDACLYCQSTLPPLLLSIKATCAGCGEKQPCLEEPAPAGAPAASSSSERGLQPGTPPPPAVPAATAAAALSRTYSGLGRRTPLGAGPAAAAAAAAAAEPSPGCVHGSGKVLSVTALCQTCHANRVLEVA